MGNLIQIGQRPAGGPGRAEVLDHSRTHLIGGVLRWKRYRPWNVPWAIGHCEFCESPFTEGGESGLISGYSVVGGGPAGQDDYCWICALCYENWREYFCWTVLDTADRPLRLPDLLESMNEVAEWPAEVETAWRRGQSRPSETAREAVVVDMFPTNRRR